MSTVPAAQVCKHPSTHEDAVLVECVMVDDSHKNMRMCRICQAEDHAAHQLVKVCMCRGSIGYVHPECILSWVKVSGKTKCELCNSVMLVEKRVVGVMKWKFSQFPFSSLLWSLLSLVATLLNGATIASKIICRPAEYTCVLLYLSCGVACIITFSLFILWMKLLFKKVRKWMKKNYEYKIMNRA